MFIHTHDVSGVSDVSDVSAVSAVSAVSDVSAVFDVSDVSVNIHSIFDFPTIGNSFVKKELPWPSHRTPAATTLTWW